MKIIHFFFYFYFLMVLRRTGWESKSDYNYFNAITAGLFFSIFLFFNIWTVLIVLGCDKLIRIVIDNFGFWGFFPLMFFPFIFVYFLCIHKKKYLKIVERFKHWDKNLKSRLLSVLLAFLYWGATFTLWGLSYHFFK